MSSRSGHVVRWALNYQLMYSILLFVVALGLCRCSNISSLLVVFVVSSDA